MLLYIILGFFALLGSVVSGQLRRKFAKYSQEPLSSGYSGKEIAEKMLMDKGISDVQITCTPGTLTDHYNPANRTVNLSEEVYHGRNIAAAAVSAHECGHAIQHATGYQWLQMRSKLVPFVSISSKIMNIVMIVGFIGAFALGFNLQIVLGIIIIAQAMIALFALVTLPVEYDASNRALAWLQMSGLAGHSEMEKAKDALKWAARTYLVSAIAAVVTLLYYVARFMGGNRN
ncbi:MAG: zinc metallopeptidase [Flavobacteriales bacterium]|jgi:Zn-dependent membrane protease YugP|nr:zinc metallopeptidase [Flavobacteriales bacterium]